MYHLKGKRLSEWNHVNFNQKKAVVAMLMSGKLCFRPKKKKKFLKRGTFYNDKFHLEGMAISKSMFQTIEL